MTRTRAFTLVELLVVITVILVMLALLVPAMEKAIYQSELAVCAARLHAVGVGTISYAIDHRRYYPIRPAAMIGTIEPYMIARREHDIRPIVGGHIDLKQLNDPLCVQVDLQGAKQGSLIWASYNMWFGWGYEINPSESVMRRMGDRFTYKNSSFNLLASDMDIRRNGFQGSHPDADGLMSLFSMQDEQFEPAQAATALGEVGTRSWWIMTSQNPRRGLIDMNTLADDASVKRYPDLIYSDDPRMTRVPYRRNSDDVTADWIYIPRVGQ